MSFNVLPIRGNTTRTIISTKSAAFGPRKRSSLRLAAKDFRLLEPRQLRAALTGIGDNRGVNLGLVPIRQRDHYERFRSVFGNLLRLAHLRQDELKHFLLEIHRGDFQQRSIDLETGYSSQYRKVCGELEGAA